LAGWEPVTVTHYEYDSDGRLVRSVSISEAEWSPDQVALLIASRQAELEIGPHGFSMVEATDPANAHAFVGQEAPTVDFARKAQLDKQDAYYKKYDTKDNPVNRNGHIWGVKKKS